MSSSVFFKFKSQKEPSRVTFDGTGISVFELKREIIQINRLGDGSDFDLAIYNQDSNEEYDDDTTIIPRSTSIVARRLPPTKPGKGTAQRYVSGKMPTTSLPNAGRRERNYGGMNNQMPKKPEMSMAPPQMENGGAGGESEEDRIAAMLQTSSEQWNKTQEQLAAATPVYRQNGQGGGFKKNTAPAPNHPPPSGYVCYRCGEKGHWIQQCPTNADPTFDGRPRVKRTTGIPRSFLKTVEKPVAQPTDDPTALPSNPTSIMVNAEGEYVVAQPDQASWENYQKKAGTAKEAAPKGDKELQERGIECSLCMKMMKDASKTPCCGKVYCEECIQNALLESDFVCPSCDAKEILLGALIDDKETRDKVSEYKKEKETAKSSSSATTSIDKSNPSDNTTPAAQAIKSTHPPTAPNNARPDSKSPSVSASTTSTPIPSTTSSNTSKKRAADDDIGPEVPRGPAAMRNAQHHGPNNFQNNAYGMPMYPQNFPNPYAQQFQNFAGGYPMGMNMNMGMPMGAFYNPNMFYDQMGMQGYPQYNNFQNANGQQGGFHNPMMNRPPQQQQQHQQPQQQAQGQQGVFPQQQQGAQAGGFAPFTNQQKTVFSDPFPSEEDSPYMRKPVNPHRHARPKRIRPSDFKAVGGEMM